MNAGQPRQAAGGFGIDTPESELVQRAAAISAKTGRKLEITEMSLVMALLHGEGRKVLTNWLKGTLRSFQQHVRPPSHLAQPYMGTTIDAIGSATCAKSATTTVLTFLCPHGARGVIRGFGQGVADGNAWDNITWHLRINGTGRQPYAAVTEQIGTILNPWRESVIHLRANETATIACTNADTVNGYDCAARMVGWYYPIKLVGDDGIRSTLGD